MLSFYSTNIYLDYDTFLSDNNNQERQPRTVSKRGARDVICLEPQVCFLFIHVLFYSTNVYLESRLRYIDVGQEQQQKTTLKNSKLEGLETQYVLSPRYVSYFILLTLLCYLYVGEQQQKTTTKNSKQGRGLQ